MQYRINVRALAVAALIFGSVLGVSQAQAGGKYITTQQIEQCKAQPDLTWCKAPAPCSATTCTEQDIKARVYATEQRARAGFRYVEDKGEDQWRAYVNQAAWTGDCDDLTSTVAEDLALAGVPNNRVWRALVYVDAGKKPAAWAGKKVSNHTVAIVKAEDGTYWVAGDANQNVRAPYPLRTARYKVVLVSRMDDGKWDYATEGLNIEDYLDKN